MPTYVVLCCEVFKFVFTSAEIFSLALLWEVTSSPNILDFLFGVLKLIEPSPSGPGESLSKNVLESSLGHGLLEVGVLGLVPLLFGRTGDLSTVCGHFPLAISLLLYMVQILFNKQR